MRVLVYEPYGCQVYGAIRHLISVVSHIDRRKFDVLVVSPDKREYWNEVQAAGGRCMALSPPPSLQLYGARIMESGLGVKVRAALGIARYTIPLASLMRGERVDIVHCNSVRSLMTAGLAAKAVRLPVVWYVNAELRNLVLDRICYGMASRIVFQCRSMRDMKYPRLVKRYRAKIRILKNGIDLEGTRDAARRGDENVLREELGVRPEYVNIFFLGTVNPRKGVHYLLEAFALLREKVPNVMLYVVGDSDGGDYSEYQQSIHAIIKSKGLFDRVVFTGWRPDGACVLALADIYALSSVDEGVPKSIIEAMAMGIPVVATRVGGVPELVRHGETGFVVAAKNPAAMAEAMVALCRDRELRKRFGERGRRIAWAEYSIRDHVSGLENLYAELAKAKRRR